ncbi:MAG: HRDC domain-containing protein [Actinomycetaceae bacterium]|nr:HRDC domain-containing protein [Actinomycetaceae bacterium]
MRFYGQVRATAVGQGIDGDKGLAVAAFEGDTTVLTQPAAGIPPLTRRASDIAVIAKQLKNGKGPVAIDAERASGVTYSQSAYLIQLRREGAGTVLIDPKLNKDLSAIGSALVGAEWILHAADQDLPCLAAVGMVPDKLFDTEIAARLLGFESIGLAACTRFVLGKELVKDHQANDWSYRPLPPDWLRYAALDVELLIPLRNRMAQALVAAGKWQWAVAEMEHVRTAPPHVGIPKTWRDTPGIGKISDRRSLEILRRLWLEREEIAAYQNIAPGKILSNKTLILAALARPKNRRELLNIGKFRDKTARQNLSAWARAVRGAAETPQSALPQVTRPPRQHFSKEAKGRLVTIKQAVRQLATELRIWPENLLSPRAQKALASADNQQIEQTLLAAGARQWQIELITPLFSELLGAA